jgi:hypothetical protein
VSEVFAEEVTMVDTMPRVVAIPFQIDAQSTTVCVLHKPEELEALTVVVKRALYGSETHQLDVTARMRDLGGACMNTDMPVNSYVGLDPLPGVPKKMWVIADVYDKHSPDREWVFLIKEHGNKWHFPIIVFEQTNRSFSSSSSSASSTSSSSSSPSLPSSSLELSNSRCVAGTAHGSPRCVPGTAHGPPVTRLLESKDEKRSETSSANETIGLEIKTSRSSVGGDGGECKSSRETKKAETKVVTTDNDVALQKVLAQSLLDMKCDAQRGAGSATSAVPEKIAVYVLGSPHDTALWRQVDTRVVGLMKDAEQACIGSLYASEHSSSHLAKLKAVPTEAPLLVAFGGLQTSYQLETWLHSDSSTSSSFSSSSSSDSKTVTPKVIVPTTPKIIVPTTPKIIVPTTPNVVVPTVSSSSLVSGDDEDASSDAGETLSSINDFEEVVRKKVDSYFAWIAQLVLERGGGTRIAVSSFLPVTQIPQVPQAPKIPRTPATGSLSSVSSISSSLSSPSQTSRKEGIVLRKGAIASHKQLGLAVTHKLRTINAILMKRCHERGLFYLDVFSIVEADPHTHTRRGLTRAIPLLQTKLDQFIDFCHTS